MSSETFKGYLQQIEYRYGKEMRTKVETLYQKGHLGEDICVVLIGQSPAHPIILDNLGTQIEQKEQKSRRM